MSTPHWEKALQELPKSSRIPAFFFAHGSPLLIWPENQDPGFPGISVQGPKGSNAQFLRYFGKFLLERYNPKAIVVFSAHWESDGKEIEVMDYQKNHLLYDYYGFPNELYQVKFESNGSSEVAKRVEDLLKKNNIPAKRITKGRGLDHGVFVPFILMFPSPFQVPIIEVSMHKSLDPQKLIDMGKALAPLRDEGILLLSGGLTIHTFQEMHAFDPKTAPQGIKDFDNAVADGIEKAGKGDEVNKALIDVTQHPFYRRAHPRTEHFVPIFLASGAGADGAAKVVAKLHGALTVAFGL